MNDHETSSARPSFADPREIDEFVEMLDRFERGDIDAERWRAFRVPRGAYGQRQDGFHMLRTKLPQGLVDAGQLRALADVAAHQSRGWGHVTTRQNFQFHFVRPRGLEPALRTLAAAGITTLGACGNAVRNVVACGLAGVAEDEPFDVTPYAEAVTRHFLRHPRALSLPRKFKVAFEGCAEDHVVTPIHDLGFRARTRPRDGALERGFSLTVAGGTSSVCTSGHLLFEFLPARDVLAVAEAIVRVFDARGDRVNRKRNRLKFLVKQLGLEAFVGLFDAELARIRAEGIPALPFDPEHPPEEQPPSASRPVPWPPAKTAAHVSATPLLGPGSPPKIAPTIDVPPGALERFTATNVRRQRQPGYVVVTVSLPQGDVSAPQLEILSNLVTAFGDGTARFTNRGQVQLRWVRIEDVPPLHQGLAAAGLARDGAGSAADVVACPGAEACALAVTHTRPVSGLIEGAVRALGTTALSTALPISISGCPNGCGQHHLSAIGLQGSVKKIGGTPVPHAFVLLGGRVDSTGASFGQLAAKVPSTRVPGAIQQLVRLYLEERQAGEAAGAFFARSLDRAKALLAPFEEVRPEDLVPDDQPLHEDAPAARQRSTSTGIALCVSTFCVSLPISTALTPRRP